MTQPVPLKLLLLDRDSIFRLGFVTAIAKVTQVKIIGEVNSISEVLTFLTKQVPDVIIFDHGVNLTLDEPDFWQDLQKLQQQYAQIKLLLLSYSCSQNQLIISQNIGVKGYVQKGIALEEIIAILQKIGQGETYWQSLPINHQKNQPFRSKLIEKNSWLWKIYQSGLKEINQHLQEVKTELKSTKISPFDQQFLQGRKRELLAAHWLIKHILPFAEELLPNELTSSVLSVNKQVNLVKSNYQNDQGKNNLSLSIQFPSLINLDQGHCAMKPILENTLNLIQLNEEILNNTGLILEIEILKPTQIKQLLYLVLAKVYTKLEELKFLKIEVKDLPEKTQFILTQIWQETTFDFISQNSKVNLHNNLNNLIIKDTIEMQQEILFPIPLVKTLCHYWIFQDTILIEKTPYSFNTPEGNQRAEMILQNLVINLSNAVVQFILNHFAEEEEIKDKLYKSAYYSSREMAKFRNLLSSQYRKQKLFIEPKLIFESQHQLFYFNNYKIEQILIYFPRQQELENLKGFPWLITMILEFRDAIAPILQGVMAFLGKGLVYILTQVIGRGLGLIGKGILQGVGYNLPKK